MTTRGLQPEHISCLCLVCYRHVSWAAHRQTSHSSALWIKHLKHLFSLYLLKRWQTIKVYITDQKEAGTYNTRSVYNFSVIHFNWLSILTVNMWPSRRRVDLHADGLQGVVSPFQDFHCKVRHGAILTIPPMWSLAQSLSKDQDMHLSACEPFMWLWSCSGELWFMLHWKDVLLSLTLMELLAATLRDVCSGGEVRTD